MKLKFVLLVLLGALFAQPALATSGSSGPMVGENKLSQTDPRGVDCQWANLSKEDLLAAQQKILTQVASGAPVSVAN